MDVDKQQLETWLDGLEGSPLAAQHPEVAAVIANQRERVVRDSAFLNEEGFNNTVSQFKAGLLSTLAFCDPVNHFANLIPETYEGMSRDEFVHNFFMQYLFQMKFSDYIISNILDTDTREALSSKFPVPSVGAFNSVISDDILAELQSIKKPTLLLVPNVDFMTLRQICATFGITFPSDGYGYRSEPEDNSKNKWSIYVVDGRENADAQTGLFGADLSEEKYTQLLTIRGFAMFQALGDLAGKSFASNVNGTPTNSFLLSDVDVDGGDSAVEVKRDPSSPIAPLVFDFSLLLDGDDLGLPGPAIELRKAIKIM